MRAVKENDTVWKNFEDLFSVEGEAGQPLVWNNSYPEIENGVVKFDTRLIKLLTYLSRQDKTACGGSTKHDLIGLYLGTGDSTSDLTNSKGNLPSSSTLTRGTGVRVTHLDKIKCTKTCQSGNLPPISSIFASYGISLIYSSLTQPTDTVPSNCRVTCAVGYYPMDPIDASLEEKTATSYPAEIAKYDPGTFDYLKIEDNSRKAATLKIAQLAYEILNVDKAGCYSTSANVGNRRIIATSLIFPVWAVKAFGEDWQKVFVSLAKKNVPFNFQLGSPLAGISYDPLLNNGGLHINY